MHRADPLERAYRRARLYLRLMWLTLALSYLCFAAGVVFFLIAVLG